MNRET